jgi:hypothetical protein
MANPYYMFLFLALGIIAASAGLALAYFNLRFVIATYGLGNYLIAFAILCGVIIAAKFRLEKLRKNEQLREEKRKADEAIKIRELTDAARAETEQKARDYVQQKIESFKKFFSLTFTETDFDVDIKLEESGLSPRFTYTARFKRLDVYKGLILSHLVSYATVYLEDIAAENELVENALRMTPQEFEQSSAEQAALRAKLSKNKDQFFGANGFMGPFGCRVTPWYPTATEYVSNKAYILGEVLKNSRAV